MDLQIRSKATKHINRTSVLQQTAFWSEVKLQQGIHSKAFDIKIKESDLHPSSNRRDSVVDDVLILFQNIGDDCTIAYVPYGPTLKPSEENQGRFLEELSEALRRYLPSNCIALRYDLLWESIWTNDDFYFDENGNWMGPPSIANQEIRLNYDTCNWNLKRATTNILPSDTVFIDLEKGSEQILKAMKPKTRYNVRLSFRKGVHVRNAEIDEFGIWYELYKDTCTRNHIFCYEKKYFQTVLGTDAGYTKSPAKVELLIAEIEKVPLAAMFLVFSNKRATYLYGASSSINRNLMAPYALQWEAICRARTHGCTEYDMFGIAPNPSPSHPLYGLYKFKTGFGGSIFHRMGCWDYPLNTPKYDMYRTAEIKAIIG